MDNMQQGVVAQSQTDRPCYIVFEMRPVQDMDKSEEEGHYVAKDEDFVIITPPGGTLVVEKKVSSWFSEKKVQRDPFVELYERQYSEWKQGNEIPEDGTPIKTWPVLSPAQCQTILKANVRTVEDLACANDSALRLIGMEARKMQRQAQAWLSSAKDVGKTAKKLEKLEVKVEGLTDRNGELQAALEAANAQLDRLLSPAEKPSKNIQATKVEAKEKRDEDPEL